MNYTYIGESGEKISAIGFGSWAIGGHGYGKIDDYQSARAIGRALDLGINIFDTADIYGFGHSEEVLSSALGDRIKDVVVATKFGVRWDESGRTRKDCSVEYSRKALEASLRRLNTDCIPLYQLHWHDGVTPLSDVFDALFRFREEGKIRYIGCSNIPISDFLESSGPGNIVSVQLPFSLSFRHKMKDLIVYRGQFGMTTLVYGVLTRGLLSGKYVRGSTFGKGDTRETDPEFRENMDRNSVIVEGIKKISNKYRKTPSQVAIRWALENPFVSCALVGIKTEEQACENAGATGWSLESEDREYLSSLVESGP